jgi:RHS repeat-associated protein
VALTSGNVGSMGNTVEVYEYDVYGRVGATDASHPNRMMFTGREYDKETGLYYYRARYYNPQIGRFLQTDPVGYDDGMNWYAYCGNSPIGLTDPSGLWANYTFQWVETGGGPYLGVQCLNADGGVGTDFYFTDWGDLFDYANGTGKYTTPGDFCDGNFDRAAFNASLAARAAADPSYGSGNGYSPSGPPPGSMTLSGEGTTGDNSGSLAQGDGNGEPLTAGAPQLPRYVPPTGTKPLGPQPTQVRRIPSPEPKYRDIWNKKVIPRVDGQPMSKWARIASAIGRGIAIVGSTIFRVVPIVVDPNMVFPQIKPRPMPYGWLEPYRDFETPEVSGANGDYSLLVGLKLDRELCEIASKSVIGECVLQERRGRKLEGMELT